jgi:hypothetical protein
MKKLLIIGLGFGFILNANSSPFYKVQCYDANNRVISCDEKAKVASKKPTKKIAKKKVKKETLAEKKARERAMALRELAKRNEALKSELEALRNANLLASAKTSEEPESALLAPEVKSAVPAPVQISTTQIASDIEPVDEAKWIFSVSNEIAKSFRTDSPIVNELDLALTYSPTKSMFFTFEEDLYWNWTNPQAAANSGFQPDDPQFVFDYIGLYSSESKQTRIDGRIKLVPGVIQASRDAGKLLGINLRARTTMKFNDGKGYVRLDPEVNAFIHKYSTSAPTANQYQEGMFDAGGIYYETLSPNTRFSTSLKTIVNHRLMDSVNLEAAVRMRGSYKYADEVVNGGQIHTITPAGWVNDLVITVPKVIVSVSERFSIEGKFEANCKNISNLSLFGVDDYNDLGVFFRFTYEI